jgi:hypothetical protein
VLDHVLESTGMPKGGWGTVILGNGERGMAMHDGIRNGGWLPKTKLKLE